MKIKIIADEGIPFLKGLLDDLADIRYYPAQEISSELIRDADALLIRTRTRCDAGLLEGSSVRFIATATIGHDHIDQEFCRMNHISWRNAAGCNASSVMHYVASALAEIRNLQKKPLAGKTMGIIGAGNVGSRVEKLSRCLGMRVLLNDPPRARNEGAGGFTSLDTLLKESDIVSLHVPLNMKGEDPTFHLLNSVKLGLVKKDVILINTSRGEVVNTRDLSDALSSGMIGGAVLDVWEGEPAVDLDLLKQALIATPHIAGYSVDGKATGTSMVIRSLSEFFRLPFAGWYPENLPPPGQEIMEIGVRGKSTEECLLEVFTRTYPIMEDDRCFRASARDFEKLRITYSPRRDARAYSIRSIPVNRELNEKLIMLGYKIMH